LNQDRGSERQRMQGDRLRIGLDALAESGWISASMGSLDARVLSQTNLQSTIVSTMSMMYRHIRHQLTINEDIYLQIGNNTVAIAFSNNVSKQASSVKHQIVKKAIDGCGARSIDADINAREVHEMAQKVLATHNNQPNDG
jgi:hypothetical protein